MFKKIIFLILLSLCGSLVATDFIPSGDINGRGIYAIKNFTNISANNISAYIMWSYITGVPAYVINYSPIIASIGNWSADKSSYTPTVNLPVYNNGTVLNVSRGFGFNNTGTGITSTGTLDINSTIIQRRFAASCTTGIGYVDEDGTVHCTASQTIGFYNASQIEALGNLTNYYNKTASDGRYIQNGSNANLSFIYANGINSTGDISVNSGYLYGQPLLGMMGSGLIESTGYTGTKTSDINITCTGLVCTYNAFKVRIMQGNAAQFATYCSMPNGTLNVPDNTFAAYYVSATNSSNCAVQQTTFDTWFSTTMETGGKWDFAWILTQNGNAEVIDSILLEQRSMMKQRILNYYTQQSQVISGFGLQAPTTIAAGFNITAGKTVFGMDVVDVNTHIVNSTPANRIEMIGHNGSASTWQFNDINQLNITHCDNGTEVVSCTGNGWRRSFIFMIGYDGGLSSSELHALYPLLSSTYASAGACLDTTTHPLTYTLPDQYTGAAVMLYAYCTQRTATNWNTANLIDLRTVKTGSATGGTDISGLVPYSGATGSVNLNGYNLTASYLIGNTDWTAEKVNYTTTDNLPTYNNLSGADVVSLVGNWSADKSSYPATSTLVGLVGNWTADKPSYPATSTLVGLVGNWTADKGSYTNTAGIATLMGNSTIARTGNCPAGQVAQNTTTSGVQCMAVSVTETDPLWSANSSTVARTGTATCAAGTVAMNITTTTSGITSQCVVATTATGNVTASNATLDYVPFFTNSTNIANGRIYWNGTCLVNIGSTSTFNVC